MVFCPAAITLGKDIAAPIAWAAKISDAQWQIWVYNPRRIAIIYDSYSVKMTDEKSVVNKTQQGEILSMTRRMGTVCSLASTTGVAFKIPPGTVCRLTTMKAVKFDASESVPYYLEFKTDAGSISANIILGEEYPIEISKPEDTKKTNRPKSAK